MEEIRKLIIEKYRYDCDGSELENIVSEAKSLLESIIGNTDLNTLENRSGHLAKPYLAIEQLQQENKQLKDKLDKIRKYIQNKISADYDEQDCCVDAVDKFCIELLDFIEDDKQ